MWVNAADDPSACSFTLPAVVRQGPVMVTVSTAGHSPALASWIRGQLAAQLGPEVGLLAEWLSEAREELKAAGRSTEDVDWRPALDWDMLELIRSGRHGPGKGAPPGVSVVVVGLNHRTTPLSVLEPMTVSPARGWPRPCTTWPAGTT